MLRAVLGVLRVLHDGDLRWRRCCRCERQLRSCANCDGFCVTTAVWMAPKCWAMASIALRSDECYQGYVARECSAAAFANRLLGWPRLCGQRNARRYRFSCLAA